MIQQDDNALRLLKHLNLRIMTLLSRQAPAPDITPVQCDIMGHIFCRQEQGQSINSTQLHRDMHLSRATVSSLLKKLRAAGYLEFVADSRDERQKQILLTEKAKRHQAQIKQSFEQVQDSLFADFCEEEKEECMRLLNKMLQNLDAALAGQEAGSRENQAFMEAGSRENQAFMKAGSNENQAFKEEENEC